MPLLQVKDIGKASAGASVLRNISFDLQKGQRLVIMGETGSGKSTLLKIIGGRDQATSGAVLFEEAHVPGIDEKLLPGHPGIAYLSQQHSLPQHLRVEQVLEYAASDTIENPRSLYEWCRIDHLLQRKTHQLSGGEQQRVATACLLLNTPKLLLLDEPFSNLDGSHKTLMKTILAEAESRLGITTILVSHDSEDLLPWADRLLVLKEGMMIQDDAPEIIYRQPANEYAAALVGAYNLLSPATLRLWGITMPTHSGGAIVRPEGFQIVTAGSSGVAGTITRVEFMGSSYRLEVALATQMVLVEKNSEAPQKGARICLSLPAKAIWFV